jgi:hypothetical protein
MVSTGHCWLYVSKSTFAALTTFGFTTKVSDKTQDMITAVISNFLFMGVNS